MDSKFEDKYIESESDWWWFVGRRKLILQIIKKIKYSSVLEIGCGTAMLSQYLDNYVGIDNSTKLCKDIIGDAHKLPFKDKSFDLVLLLDVLEHTNDKVVMSEVKRIIKKDGYVILIVPAFMSLWSQHDVDNKHVRRYNRSTIPINGFEIVMFTYWNSLLFPLMVLMKKRKSQLIKISVTVNYVLTKVLELENYMISKGVRLPIGVSLIYLLKVEV